MITVQSHVVLAQQVLEYRQYEIHSCMSNVVYSETGTKVKAL